ncbi:MAG: DUF924 family protein [Candidatus Dactylopiibacterium sp.]|nr:DUF924 family protein [Candidatus Dactylopiibacterium sp.]
MIEDILQFWFVELPPAKHWQADPALDAAIAARFGAEHAAARRGERHAWRIEARGRLAEILVLDQFSRNIHRGSARAFENDAMALALAQEAVAGGHDRALPPPQRQFLYMPYMHSESPLIHAQAERLFAGLGEPLSYDFELRHKAIIDRFGRYPHRNETLGRTSTAEELAFLAEPGSRF